MMRWRGTGRVLGVLLVFMGAQMVSAWGVMFVVSMLGLYGGGGVEMSLTGEPGLLAWTLIVSSLLTLLVMRCCGWTDRGSFRLRGLSGRCAVVTLVWMVPIMFVVNVLLEWSALEDVNGALVERLVHNGWGVLAVVLMSPFCEEVVFRMGIQRNLTVMGMRPQWAIVVTSLLFGLIHANPVQIPGAFVFGIVLGWLYMRSGTIWLPVGAHVFNNMVSVVLAHAPEGTDTTMVGLCGGTTGAVVAVVVSLFLIAMGYRYLDKSLARA